MLGHRLLLRAPVCVDLVDGHAPIGVGIGVVFGKLHGLLGLSAVGLERSRFRFVLGERGPLKSREKNSVELRSI